MNLRTWLGGCAVSAHFFLACKSGETTPPPCLGSALGEARTSSQPASPPPSISGSLTFVWEGKPRELLIDDLLRAQKPVEIEVDDPYYKQRKRYRALALVPAFEQGFGKGLAELRRAHFVLEAKDGYQTPIDGQSLLVGDVYLAFADLDHPSWQPIGPRGADPGPLYVVWVGPGHGNTDVYPHPWALSRVVASPGPAETARTAPPGGFGTNTLAQAGHAIFERRCLHCHSVNRQGGKLGPELNVPQNILSYRPEADVRAFIKNPETFRYSAMLPNPDLSETDLDAIVAYLRLMASHQDRSP